ncbi:cation exchanger 1 [Haematococcus lacustris]
MSMQRNRAIASIKAGARWKMLMEAAASGHLDEDVAALDAPLVPGGLQPNLSLASRHSVPGADMAMDPLQGRTGLSRDMAAVWALVMGSPINLLLLALPVAAWANYAQWSAVAVFSLNFCSLIPLALILGDITEDLAVRFGETVGGLINASFGNVVEIILSIAALQKGLYTVVAASLLGSILSNLLLVLGCCMFFGGLNFKTQTFNAVGNRACSSLLFLSVIGIVMPTAAGVLVLDHEGKEDWLLDVSRATAIILLVIYVLYLAFQLGTHKELFSGEGEADGAVPRLSLTAALGCLTLITVIVSACSEYLTASLEAVSHKTGLSQGFLGLIVLPIAGNACEHITAVIVATKNKMDLALGVAVGSSIQIALFAMPLCVVVGWATGHPFSMELDPFSAVVLTASVIHSNFITADATSHWLLGVQLVAVYFLVAVTYYFR